MDCPNCIERLTLTEASGIQTYTCKYCCGIWVPERSMAVLLKREGESISPQHLILSVNIVRDSTRQCAVCPNQKLKVLKSHGVELDICTKCYGLFFDQDEINQFFPNSHDPQLSSSGMGKYVAGEGLFWLIIAFFTGAG